MPVSAQRFKGKLKREIADEAFAKYGEKTTIKQVDAYFKEYGISHCERSMFAAAKRRAEGKPPPLPRKYRNEDVKLDVVDVVVRVIQLSNELGSWENLEELIRVLRGTAT